VWSKRHKDFNQAENQNQNQAQQSLFFFSEWEKQIRGIRSLNNGSDSGTRGSKEFLLDQFDDHWQLVLQENKESKDERIQHADQAHQY